MRAFRSLVRKEVRRAAAVKHASRVRIFDNNMTASTLTAKTLITCDDDPDYDLTTDGTNIAEMQPLKRIRSLSLDFALVNIDSNKVVEWVLFKSPDGTIDTMAPSDIFTADVSVNTMQYRKNTLAYGWFVGASNTDYGKSRIRVRRAALKRTGVFNDGDKLIFAVKGNNASDTIQLTMTGRIVWG